MRPWGAKGGGTWGRLFSKRPWCRAWCCRRDAPVVRESGHGLGACLCRLGAQCSLFLWVGLVKCLWVGDRARWPRQISKPEARWGGRRGLCEGEEEAKLFPVLQQCL